MVTSFKIKGVNAYEKGHYQDAKTNERITMQVVDMYGRIIETRSVTVNSLISFGDRYTAETYFVRVIQDKQHKEIKLIKLSD